MRPEDELDAPGRSPNERELPGSVDLTALEDELAEAGDRVRRGWPAQATPTFTADLRARLVATYGTAGAARDLASSGPALTRPLPAAQPASSSSRARGVDEAWLHPLPTSPLAHPPTRLRARPALRTPTLLPAPRWSILGVAATLIVAIGVLSGNLLSSAPPESRVAAAVGAELTRRGEATILAAGTQLEAGDEIRIAGGGSASLQLGASRVRLAGGAEIRLVTLEPSRITVDQIAGRAWHRVDLPDGGRYVVMTADVSWTAVGTAFDLDRDEGDATGGDIVRELSIRHDVLVEGPGLRVTVGQGRGATVRLGAAPTIETLPVAAATAITDPWVRQNAAADRAVGLPLGMLDDVNLAIATMGPTATAMSVPTGSPPATEAPGDPATPGPLPPATPAATSPPAPTPTPKAQPTAKPTATPSAKPTSSPTVGPMSMAALACPGGVVLDWSVPGSGAFSHVQVLRGTTADIPTSYPPSGGVVAVDGGYTANPAKTEGFDPTSSSESAWYRTVAYDAGDRAIAASVVTGVRTVAVGDLGMLDAVGTAAGELTFSWTPFLGSGDCFSYYKLVASLDDPTPSYLEGSNYLAAIGEQMAAGAVVGGLASGKTLWLRLQAVRATDLGKFIVAQTVPIQLAVP